MSTFQKLTLQMSAVIDTVGDVVRKPGEMSAEAAVSASEADRRRRGLNRRESKLTQWVPRLAEKAKGSNSVSCYAQLCQWIGTLPGRNMSHHDFEKLLKHDLWPCMRSLATVHATITAPIYLAFEYRPSLPMATLDVVFELVLLYDVVRHFQKGVLDPESSKRVRKFDVSLRHWFRSLRVLYDFMTAFPVTMTWLILTNAGVFDPKR